MSNNVILIIRIYYGCGIEGLLSLTHICYRSHTESERASLSLKITYFPFGAGGRVVDGKGGFLISWRQETG